MVYATPEAQELAEVKAERDELRRQVAELQKQVAELLSRLKQDSSNSHKPPSSDGPGKRRGKKKPGEKKATSGLKRGGQVGHEGSHRELLPESQVDDVIDMVPETCERCGGQLKDVVEPPKRVQVTELPVVKPTVTEYRLHKRKCACCNETTQAQPPAVVHGSFGPRLVAVTSMLRGAYRQSVSNTRTLLKELFGIEISTGAVSNVDRQVQLALEAPYQQALEGIRCSGHVHIDETGHFEENQRHWLWGALSGGLCVFSVHKRRSQEAMKSLLGNNYQGVVISDRWSSYSCFDPSKRQLCWAHLKRDFQKMVDLEHQDSHIGSSLLGQQKKLFDAWRGVKAGDMSRPDFTALVRDIIAPEVARLLQLGSCCDSKKISGMCDNIAKTETALWTFVGNHDIEPTNNPIERALRHPVIWRKISFGSQSKRGSRFVERILTAVASLRLQRRNLLDYLELSITAHRCRLDYPSLLPQPDTG